jgi:hypothetical protein
VLTRTPMRSRLPAPAPRDPGRAARIAAQTPPPSLHTATMAGSTTGPAPKTTAYRDPVLLEMARGRRCLLNVVEGCRMASGDTTVAAHSNSGIHGKGKARKADDVFSAWACDRCHAWLDTGTAPRARKEEAFMQAHLRQVLAWRAIVADPTEPQRLRRAAQRALGRLGATPVGELP